MAPGHLRGDEPVVAVGVTSDGPWQFDLPAIVPPRCRVVTRYGMDRTVHTVLDTVILDADERQVILLWRCSAGLRTGPHDLRALVITCENAPPRSDATEVVAAATAEPATRTGGNH